MKQWFSLFICLLTFQLSSEAQAQDNAKPYALVMFATGEIQLYHKGDTTASNLKRGDAIQLGDRITTGEHAKLTLVTSTRKIINLPENSELTTNSDSAAAAIPGLGLGMFKSMEGRSDIGAQAAVRAKDRTVLLKYPRYGFIRDRELVLHFEPLDSGENYHIKIISTRQPRFIFETKIHDSSFNVNKDVVGNDIKMGQPYWISVEKVNMRDKPLQTDFDELAVVMIAPETRTELENAEKALQTMQSADSVNVAYPTLLAETYEAFELYHEAISVYERIFNELAPGDEYSRLRLKDLYARIKDPIRFQEIQTAQERSGQKNQ